MYTKLDNLFSHTDLFWASLVVLGRGATQSGYVGLTAPWRAGYIKEQIVGLGLLLSSTANAFHTWNIYLIIVGTAKQYINTIYSPIFPILY